MAKREFFRAVESGKTRKVRGLLKAQPDLVHGVYDLELPDQPLHVAAVIDNAVIAAVLIDAGADVNARGHRGRSPLGHAAFHGSPRVAKLLIQAGADLEQLDDSGFTPLFAALRSREQESAEVRDLLISHGAHMDLNSAVCLGDASRVRALLAEDRDAVSNSRFPGDLVYDAVIFIVCRVWDEAGLDASPASTEAAVQSNRAILDQLLQHGADPNATGHSTWPPLFEAAQLSHPALARILIEHGANIDTASTDGTTALDLAGQYPLTRAFLVQAGARQ